MSDTHTQAPALRNLTGLKSHLFRQSGRRLRRSTIAPLTSRVRVLLPCQSNVSSWLFVILDLFPRSFTLSHTHHLTIDPLSDPPWFRDSNTFRICTLGRLELSARCAYIHTTFRLSWLSCPSVSEALCFKRDVVVSLTHTCGRTLIWPCAWMILAS